MGCGASKNDVIKSASSADGPTDKKKAGKEELKKSKDSLNSSVLSEGSTIPANDMYQNGGNNNGGPLNNKGLKTLPPLKPVRSSKVLGEGEAIPRPEPIAFEVPADDGESDASLIKKHPPRRLIKQMEEHPPDLPNLTHEDIEEKVALANQRRNQVLTQRVASARQKSARGGRMRKPGPGMDSEQYNMAEYENEIDGLQSQNNG